MKRYVVEFANDVEKNVPEERLSDVLQVRNAYIIGWITEFEAMKALIKIVEEEKQ